VSGHVHLVEIVSYATPQPTQIVSGNGGSWADIPLPRDLPPGATPAPGAVVESFVTTDRYGYMTLERDAEAGGAWRIEARDRDGPQCRVVPRRSRRLRSAPVPDAVVAVEGRAGHPGCQYRGAEQGGRTRPPHGRVRRRDVEALVQGARGGNRRAVDLRPGVALRDVDVPLGQQG